jgi:ankyrin repeat protein
MHSQVNAKDRLGMTALHWTAYNGHKECANMLLEAHATIDAVNEEGLFILTKSKSKTKFFIHRKHTTPSCCRELSF